MYNPAQRPHISAGTYGAWPFRRTLQLRPSDYHTHMHCIGVSKSGKSNFLAHLFLSLLAAGHSATIFDPHGDLARLVLSQLVARGFYRRPDAFERLLYLDIAGADRRRMYLPFNVLKQPVREDSIASNMKEAFHRAWPELSQGAATFDTLFPDSVLLLLHNDLPITRLRALLTNAGFRESLLAREKDHELVASFRDVYDKLTKTADQVQYAGSVLRRARQLTQLDVLRYGLGQKQMVLDFRRIIDNNQSLIVTLDLQNADAKRLLGCFLTVGAEQAALSRSEIPAHQRVGSHFLIMDEFQLFVAQSEASLNDILSQTRKYGLYLWLAHQTMSQVPPGLRGALQNVGMEAVFRLGAADADYMADALAHIDPLRIKHQVTNEVAVERTHPLFQLPQEQQLLLAQDIRNLFPGQAYLSWFSPIRSRTKRTILGRPAMRLVKTRTPYVPVPMVDTRQLADIEQAYLSKYFRPASVIEAEQGAFQDDSPTVLTRSGTLSAGADIFTRSRS